MGNIKTPDSFLIKVAQIRLCGFVSVLRKSKLALLLMFDKKKPRVTFINNRLAVTISTFTFIRSRFVSKWLTISAHSNEGKRSSGGRVVKLLACGTRGPGFDSRPRHLDFQRLVISCFQVEILLKDR